MDDKRKRPHAGAGAGEQHAKILHLHDKTDPVLTARPWFFAYRLNEALRDVNGMTLEARGAYISLLHFYAQTETPLPADRSRLATICGCSERKFKSLTPELLRAFEARNESWNLPWLDHELARIKERSAQASRAAKARWGKGRSDGNG